MNRAMKTPASTCFKEPLLSIGHEFGNRIPQLFDADFFFRAGDDALVFREIDVSQDGLHSSQPFGLGYFVGFGSGYEHRDAGVGQQIGGLEVFF